jgi:hypothetical protein
MKNPTAKEGAVGGRRAFRKAQDQGAAKPEATVQRPGQRFSDYGGN